MKQTFFFIATLLTSSILFSQTIWTMDKNHSQLHFSAMHFGIAPIEGIFKTFEVEMKSEKDDYSDAVFNMTANIKSIDTQVEMRDNDLRSSNWFDVEKYPNLIFKSTSVKKIKGNNYKLYGNITFHGITKPVVFAMVFHGQAVTKSKKQTSGFTIKGKLKRSDFNLGGTPQLSGVGDEIEVRANLEISKN